MSCKLHNQAGTCGSMQYPSGLDFQICVYWQNLAVTRMYQHVPAGIHSSLRVREDTCTMYQGQARLCVSIRSLPLAGSGLLLLQTCRRILMFFMLGVRQNTHAPFIAFFIEE